MPGDQDLSTSSLPKSQVLGSDLVLNPIDSEETIIDRKLGKSVSDVNGAADNVEGYPLLFDVGKDITTSIEITCEGRASANIQVLQSMSSMPSGGRPLVTIPTSELSSTTPATFTPSIGTWAKPLTFAPPATPPTPETPMDFDPQYLNNLLDYFWPTLTDELGKIRRKEIIKLLFQWAARMNLSTRNLYQAAKPTFRLDGTP
ncbi:hypothetical protein F2Q68_00011268 [Brassica cretica]|uniref:Uncharacterized protein n=1 Tax=Brassica cretica TaxID=69181 RepID=A0A8S9KTC0_BRACR|nr:hypothetical protein F2Q68_00011268 [Brassica cretica]